MFSRKQEPAMIRYQAYFERTSFAALKRIAKQRKEALSVVLREAVRDFVGARK